MVTQAGQPVECFLTPGSFGDVDALKSYVYALPDGSIIYADKAYNDYEMEDLLKEVNHITLFQCERKIRQEPYHQKSLLYSIIIVKWLKPRAASLNNCYQSPSMRSPRRDLN